MNDKIYSIEEIQSRISPIAMRYGVERVYLFGSYAKGCATAESDVDLRIDKGSLRGLFALSGMRLDICDALSKEVDLLTTNSLDDIFRSKIQNDEVMIYERACC
ncbi:MAG: nucleotidyltransferase domain-containing protein [Oscillospiraceae bacterium]|nr:nucleotidyltransferase domain-containing protein [Oscillospiraceae bacterium]